jgi:hypothetical protein
MALRRGSADCAAIASRPYWRNPGGCQTFRKVLPATNSDLCAFDNETEHFIERRSIQWQCGRKGERLKVRQHVN